MPHLHPAEDEKDEDTASFRCAQDAVWLITQTYTEVEYQRYGMAISRRFRTPREALVAAATLPSDARLHCFINSRPNHAMIYALVNSHPNITVTHGDVRCTKISMGVTNGLFLAIHEHPAWKHHARDLTSCCKIEEDSDESQEEWVHRLMTAYPWLRAFDLLTLRAMDNEYALLSSMHRLVREWRKANSLPNPEEEPLVGYPGNYATNNSSKAMTGIIDDKVLTSPSSSVAAAPPSAPTEAPQMETPLCDNLLAALSKCGTNPMVTPRDPIAQVRGLALDLQRLCNDLQYEYIKVKADGKIVARRLAMPEGIEEE